MPYTIEGVEDDATLTGHAGLPLVLETMRALGVSEVFDGALSIRQRQSGATDAKKVEALVLRMAAGGENIEDVEVLRADKGLMRLCGSLPSADVLRTFLHAFHDERLLDLAQRDRPASQVAYIPKESATLLGLSRSFGMLIHELAERTNVTRATLDHDATIQESHKKMALAHDKGGRGYQPAAIYWGELDVVLADEYRDGNANPERQDGPRPTIGFTISADMTEPLRRLCEAVPEQAWTLCDDRPTETVMCADVEFAPGDWPKDAEPLRYVALRIRKKQGQLFGGGYDTKYLAVVSNRRELAAPALIRWHWEKAGTIERVHDVTKNDLAAAVPPCGRFGANAAWYRMSLLTYNILSAMKWLAVPPPMETARPKRMRFALFSLAGRLVSHAAKLVLRIAREAEALASLITARIRIAQVGATRIAAATA